MSSSDPCTNPESINPELFHKIDFAYLLNTQCTTVDVNNKTHFCGFAVASDELVSCYYY